MNDENKMPDLSGLLSSLSGEDTENLKNAAMSLLSGFSSSDGSALGGTISGGTTSGGTTSGGTASGEAASDGAGTANAVAGLLSGLLSSDKPTSSGDKPTAITPQSLAGIASALPDVSKLLPLASVLGELSKKDERTEFIAALKPLLSEGRRAKADEAAKLIRLIGIIPTLHEQGIL